MKVPQYPALRTKTRLALVKYLDMVRSKFDYERHVIIMDNGVLSFDCIDNDQYHPQPRFGKITPPLPWLVTRLEAQSSNLSNALDACLTFSESLSRIPLTAPDQSREPRWLNYFMTGLDGAYLYSVVRAHAPALVVEIGSGNSSKFIRRAIEDGALKTRQVSVDPCPRADINDICDTVQSSTLETTPCSVFEALAPGDVLLLDASHRAFQNSDVTVFFLEILPRLPSGVMVGVHDIFLPFDYPEEWTDRLYNEQHMLAAYLLGRENAVVDFAAQWMSRQERFGAAIEKLFAFDQARRIDRHWGGFFFFRS